MKTVRFLRPAELELLDATQYYEAQAKGLGCEFLDKIDAAIMDIREAPERWTANGSRRGWEISLQPYQSIWMKGE